MATADLPEEDRTLDGNDDDREDTLDIYDTGLSNLFSVPPIAFSSSSSGLFTYTPPLESWDNRPVKLKIPTPSAEVFTKLQANHLWLSALYLADLISVGKVELGQRVIELGAGAGLPGILACRQGSEVLSTDWGDESILQCLEENFGRNCQAGRWGVIGHEWGSDPGPLLAFNRTGPVDTGTKLATGATDLPPNGSSYDTTSPVVQQFNTILLADTLWVSSAHSALLDSVQALLHPEGMVHVAAGLHTGRWPVESFISKAGERGLQVERVREVRWAGEGIWEEVVGDSGNLDESGTGEERGVVVYLRLTWRAPQSRHNESNA